MKYLAFFTALLSLSSCVESQFKLAEDSPLPYYFQIPDSTERSDYSVNYSIYSDKAELTLIQISDQNKLASITGENETHPLTIKHNSRTDYPRFSVFNFKGQKEYIAHKKMDNQFYVVTEQEIEEHYKTKDLDKTQFYESLKDVNLNNGEKWKANPETIEGINNMIGLVKNFNQSNQEDVFVQLSDDLDNEFKLIFKNCTMTGEAHDQLHNYLLPMLGMMKKIKTPPLENQENAVDRLETHLGEFDKYFE